VNVEYVVQSGVRAASGCTDAATERRLGWIGDCCSIAAQADDVHSYTVCSPIHGERNERVTTVNHRNWCVQSLDGCCAAVDSLV